MRSCLAYRCREGCVQSGRWSAVSSLSKRANEAASYLPGPGRFSLLSSLRSVAQARAAAPTVRASRASEVASWARRRS